MPPPCRFPFSPFNSFSLLLHSPLKLGFTIFPAFSFLTVAVNRSFSHIFQECTSRGCLMPGQQAHARMLVSGFCPTTFVNNCLMQLYIKCLKMEFACKVFNEMPQKDIITWNSLIFGYASSGLMYHAQVYFDCMPERDVISWNSLISGYVQNGNCWEAVEFFKAMCQMGMKVDQTTFALMLKSCSDLDDYELGIQVHDIAVKMGFTVDVVTGSALVDMYAKCKSLRNSCQVFDEMPARNSVSWSAIIAGYVLHNDFLSSLNIFKEMQQAGLFATQPTLASAFRSCAGLSFLKFGRQIHGYTFKTNFNSDMIVGTAVVDMYAKCGNLVDAQRAFSSLSKHYLQSWNAIIVGYARSDDNKKALELFQVLHKATIDVNEISLSGAFSACAGTEGYLEGLQVHGLAVKLSFEQDICVANALLDMYGKCHALKEAQRVFDEMGRRDAVSWNAIIAVLEQNGQNVETLAHYFDMLDWGMEPDEFTYGSVLKACAFLQEPEWGRIIHNRIIKSSYSPDLFVGSSLIDMYCKCGNLEEAEKLHNRIGAQTTISWNAMISGCVMHKQSEDAQHFFFKLLERGLKPDNFTYATILVACATLTTIGLGKQIHTQILKHKLQGDVFIVSALVDMYSKCGNLQESLLLFERMKERDFVSWNALISGYSQHGLSAEAIKMFKRMQAENVKPNHATLLAVLRACGNVGQLDEGLKYFYSMSDLFGLDPQLEHYCCAVDIIGRSGHVHYALKLILEMPFEPDDVMWRTLLSACKMHGNAEVAEKAASYILQSNPEDSSTYILLSNIYAQAGNWGEVSELRRKMRLSKLKKEPGCSWIEVKSQMHAFLVCDKDHSRCAEIYERLNSLIGHMKCMGYVPNIEINISDGE